jgi:hypothetical protein
MLVLFASGFQFPLDLATVFAEEVDGHGVVYKVPSENITPIWASF